MILKGVLGVTKLYNVVTKVSILLAKTLRLATLKNAAAWVYSKAKLVLMKTAMIAWRVVVLASTLVMKAARIAVLAFNLAMDANPISLVIAAVAGLVVGIVELIKHWKIVKKWTENIIDLFAKKFPNATKYTSKAVKLLGSVFVTVFKGVKTVIHDYVIKPIEYVMAHLQSLINLAKHPINSITHGVESVGSSITHGVESVGSSIGHGFENAGSYVASFFESRPKVVPVNSSINVNRNVNNNTNVTHLYLNNKKHSTTTNISSGHSYTHIGVPTVQHG
jgi:hypothetical protein